MKRSKKLQDIGELVELFKIIYNLLTIIPTKQIMKLITFILCLFSLTCFSQQIPTKTIPPSILRKLTDDNAIVEKALQFDDKNGKNYLVATIHQNRSDEWVSKAILVQHYIEKNNQFVLLRQITDNENHCEFDNDLQFLDQSLILSDLDKNNLVEITFLYKVGCRSDVSPIGLKLMVIENGNKAAIRGKTIPQGFDFKKEKVADAAFLKLPKPIQDQANKLWDKFAPEF